MRINTIIIRGIEVENITNKISEKKYWDQYYKRYSTPFIPSPFAKYVLHHYLQENKNLVELGCGNGRDAIHFAKNGMNVIAYDQCDEEIEFLADNYGGTDPEFKVGDMANLPTDKKYDFVYSRFTLHSISSADQSKVLNWISRVLLDHGYFLLEARGKKNELYRKGIQVDNEKDAFILDNHYRRFLDLQDTCIALKSIGFKIIQAIEDKGFSPINEDDETFVRIIARKN
jgi:tellurite methyltransferase